jgi:uncharacterized protein (UPF0332 family)
VTPETAEHLDKAREYLTKARNLLDVMHYNDEAGRAAYLAGFHAAQALISERTGRVAKTHDGVNSQFNLLTRDDARVDTELRSFLGRAYNLKAVADYRQGRDRSYRWSGSRRQLQPPSGLLMPWPGFSPSSAPPHVRIEIVAEALEILPV